MNLGQVYTKRFVADFMVSLFKLTGKEKVLDPCFDHGVFIESLLENSEFHIDGVEIDQYSFSQFENPDAIRYHLMNCDFFDIEESYDGIIMNPPYVRQEELDNLSSMGITKQKLQSACGFMTISSRANLYMYFILRAILLLKNGGELISIFPDSWTNTPIGKHFYRQIKLYGCVTDFIDVIGEAFEGSPMVDVCILKFVKGISGETHFQSMLIDSNETFVIENVNKQKDVPSNGLVKLSTIGNIRRGITTGANKFFVNPALFTQDHIVKILSSPKNFTGYTTLNCRQDKLLAIKHGDILNEEEEVYLENTARAILHEGKPQTLKAMIENGQPWYYIKIPKTAQIIFPYIVRNNLKFVLNTDNCNVRDNFYMINSKYDPLLLMALLNNYYVYKQLEDFGKSYGKGLLKLQKYDIDDIKIPHPQSLRQEDKERLISLSEELTKTSDDNCIDAITAILVLYYGNTIAKKQYIEMKSKRLSYHE